MAYIDTNELFKCETCRHCIGEYKCDTYCDSGECYSPNMSKLPTADVVPKSEVDKLQEETENLRNANAGLALALLYECEPTKEHLSELKKAVREKVAREIFEEIENIFGVHMLWYRFTENQYQSYLELKKKYTGEK